MEVGVHLNPPNKVYRHPWLRHRSPSLTGSGVRHIAKNAVLVQPSLNQASNSQAFNKVTFFSIDKKYIKKKKFQVEPELLVNRSVHLQP